MNRLKKIEFDSCKLITLNTQTNQQMSSINLNYDPVNLLNLGNLIGIAKRMRVKADNANIHSAQNPDDEKLKTLAKKAKMVANEKEEIIDTFINSFERRKPREFWKNENLTREFDKPGSPDWYSGIKNAKSNTPRQGW